MVTRGREPPVQTPGKGETYRPIVLFKLPTLMCAKRVYVRGHQGFVPLLGGHQRRTHTRARDSTARSRVGMNGILGTFRTMVSMPAAKIFG